MFCILLGIDNLTRNYITFKDHRYMQSWARDNSVATMGPCYQATKLFVFVILLFLLRLPHLDTEA